METQPETRRPILQQVAIASVCWFAAAVSGVSIGHSAVLLPKLQHNSSSLPTDEDMGSWIVSAFSTAIPVGVFLGGVLTDVWGRRTTLRLSMVLAFIGWLVVACANSHAMLISANAFLGFTRGMAADPIMVLLDEHSDPTQRGIYTSLSGVFLVLGVMVVTGLGLMLEWRQLAGVAALGPVIVLAGLFFVPESPVWLVRHGREQDAARVLQKLWGKNHHAQATKELNYMLSRCKKEDKLQVTTFLKPHVLKSFFVSHIYVFFQMLSGSTLFIFYTVDMIAKSRQGSEPVMEDLTAATIVGALRVFTIVVTSWLMFIIGRRKIAVTSCISTAVCCTALGTVLYLHHEGWASIILIFLYVLLSTSGLFILPIIMAGELVPSQMRGMITGYIFAFNDVALGGVVKAYPWMTQTMGMYGIFWIFGVASLACAVFVFLFVPETQGYSLAQIEDYFRGHNILWNNRPQQKQNEESYEELKLYFE